jgi:predicted PolB exonuclease-like 3'-5' exonuclease
MSDNTTYITFDIETVPVVKFELTPIQNEELQKKIDKEITYLKNTNPTQEIDVVALSNRIAATSPYWGEIICICLHAVKPNGQIGTIKLIGTEYEILTRFWNNIDESKWGKHVFVSYNGLGFDVPFILRRSAFYKIAPKNNNFLNLKRFSFDPHFDVATYLSDWSPQKMISLKLACDYLGVPSPKEGEVKAENVNDAYINGEIDKIADYCARDVEATYNLFLEVKPYCYISKGRY